MVNPQKVRNVDAILEKLQGQVKPVFGKLAEKYEHELANNPRGECGLASLIRFIVLSSLSNARSFGDCY